MSRQLTLGEGFDKYAKTTKRAQFLREIDRIIPWADLCDLIAPVCPAAGAGRPPLELKMMLRIYFLQQWFNFSDPAAEDALYDSVSMRDFVGVGVGLGEERAPDETTICRFRHLLEREHPGSALCEHVLEYLESNGIKVGRGTLVDATIIGAPDSPLRDEGAHRRRQPNQGHSRRGGDSSQCT